MASVWWWKVLALADTSGPQTTFFYPVWKISQNKTTKFIQVQVFSFKYHWPLSWEKQDEDDGNDSKNVIMQN